MGLICYFLDFS